MEEKDNKNLENDNGMNGSNSDLENVIHLAGMYENWFLDYASYVILERSVPYIDDGLKPVQRRILHAMYEIDDGRYTKVANVIGNTMKYHPHGDSAIGDAIVQIGQKNLLIDPQGNWGNIYTGDNAAAARYIEARLTPFALEVAFNPKTTVWQTSYDGRNKEPVSLPMKFPLLLAQGVEGIAVGLSCRILPHNFNELIQSSIDILRGKNPNILPDFPTGGSADFSNYNQGLRGGRVRVRAKISQLDNKTLVIREVPAGCTTTSLIDSIIAANDKGKIKIKKVEDNTSDEVEIVVYLPSGMSPDKTIDALYAFTDCEISISPNSCVVDDDKPLFANVNEILRRSTDKTVALLKKELEIRKFELEEQFFFSSLEKIFIEERVYRLIEKCETWEAVIEAIVKGLSPFISKLIRAVSRDDVVRLTDIKIKRISKFNSIKADDHIKQLKNEIADVKNNLNHLTEYAIDYFKQLKTKYGKGMERKTEIKSFGTIIASRVAAANVKLYINREEGFAGFGLRKDEFVCDCSDLDNVIVFRKDGSMQVSKITSKSYVGKDIIHIGLFKKNDSRTVYNMVYKDDTSGNVYVKRFPVKGLTRDKEYHLGKLPKKTSVLYFTSNPNGEAEVITVHLRPKPKIKKLSFEFDFANLSIKGRGSIGNILSKNAVRKIDQKEIGISTLGARKIWFDDTIQRLNVDGNGEYLGEFSGDDKILSVTQKGSYALSGYSLETHFEEDLILLDKFVPSKIVSMVYRDSTKKIYYLKRFEQADLRKTGELIVKHNNSFIELITTTSNSLLEVKYKSKNKEAKRDSYVVDDFISVKGHKAKGKKLPHDDILEINLINDPVNTAQDTEKEEMEINAKQQIKPDQKNKNDSMNQVKLNLPE